MIPHDMHLHIGSLLFEGVDQIDLTGPFEVLSRIPNATYRIHGKASAPVRDLKGLRLTPDATLADAPPLDVLHVPGGFGQETSCGRRFNGGVRTPRATSLRSCAVLSRRSQGTIRATGSFRSHTRTSAPSRTSWMWALSCAFKSLMFTALIGTLYRPDHVGQVS